MLPDGTIVLEAEEADVDVSQLAEALERSLSPPYRAEAVHHGEGRWAVAGRAIDVVELPDHVEGDALELTSHEGRTELRIDGEPEWGSLPPLERLAGRLESYVIRAERLDAALWEVQIIPL